MPVPLIASDDHLAHDGLIELLAGQPVRCFESPERATVIRDALLATGAYELQAPESHGPDPIAAVHEVELIDLVDHAWTDAVAAGRDASRPLIPDTFLLRGYPGPMPLDQLPAARHERLGAYCFDTATPIVEGTAAGVAVTTRLAAGRHPESSSARVWAVWTPIVGRYDWRLARSSAVAASGCM